MKREQGVYGIRWILRGFWMGIFLLALLFSVPLRVEAAGRFRALCVSGEPDFAFDAKYMAQALLENKSKAFQMSSRDIYAVVGQPGNTISKLNGIIDRAFRDSRSADLNLFYFTGHGYRDGEEDEFALKDVKGLVIAPGDTTAVYPYKKLAQKLSSYKGQILVVMDSCFSQAFYLNGVKKLSKARQKKFTLMLSSRWEEESYASVLAGDAYISVYTYYLLDAIGFWATYGEPNCDMDGDGYASVREIASYVSIFMKLKDQKMTPCTYLLSGKNQRLFA